MLIKHLTALAAQVEPHQIGLLFLCIAGLLVITLPTDWIKRR